MNSSLYIGATGMKGLAQGMSVTTNNLANVSTIGYKQQNALFSDILYQTQSNMGDWWNAQDGSMVAVGQVGMGVQVESVRTIFTDGPMESSNTLTDMAISGKGFFQVTDGENMYYTRAGDFRSDNEGVWRNPQGLALTGYRLDDDGQKGELEPVQVDTFGTMQPKATTELSLSLNLNLQTDNSPGSENPYFALLEKYDGTKTSPLSRDDYGAYQSMTVYDAEGNAHQITAYFDAAPSSGSSRNVEFVIGGESSASAEERGAGDGLLMSGVLQFDSNGHLVNVSAFTPSDAGNKNLEDWHVAEMSNGNPVFYMDGSPMSVNFGLSAADGWQNTPESAAAIGTNGSALPNLGEGAIAADYPTTAFNTSAMTNSYSQNGYKEGYLSTLSIGNDGRVVGQYSNGQTKDLWEIPVARFTSEDGLRREGNNIFSATEESGQMELGSAGTENYGEIFAYNIENSNVDIAQEMVNMIITQRGFQSNSKVVTTSDEMLRKAMELKR